MGPEGGLPILARLQPRALPDPALRPRWTNPLSNQWHESQGFSIGGTDNLHPDPLAGPGRLSMSDNLNARTIELLARGLAVPIHHRRSLPAIAVGCERPEGHSTEFIRYAPVAEARRVVWLDSANARIAGVPCKLSPSWMVSSCRRARHFAGRYLSHPSHMQRTLCSTWPTLSC